MHTCWPIAQHEAEICFLFASWQQVHALTTTVWCLTQHSCVCVYSVGLCSIDYQNVLINVLIKLVLACVCLCVKITPCTHQPNKWELQVSSLSSKLYSNMPVNWVPPHVMCSVLCNLCFKYVYVFRPQILAQYAILSVERTI